MDYYSPACWLNFVATQAGYIKLSAVTQFWGPSNVVNLLMQTKCEEMLSSRPEEGRE